MFTVITSKSGQQVSSFNADTLDEAYATGNKLIALGIIDDYRIW